MSKVRQRRMTERCDITRNPGSGKTGVVTVLSHWPCTPAFPTNGRRWHMATGYEGWELQAIGSELVQDEDILTVAGISYTIQRRKLYPGRGGRPSLLDILMERRR